ncbi:ArnT family glycosyltransferase [Tautonia marina]|uniref:ArnT family glycosyltransferase n=1 Tax=Tautonia marina TaxID=2653855 RepID=UPI001260B8FD|nr:glycosyltransferase family 39 protein [Tautonia marina]
MMPSIRSGRADRWVGLLGLLAVLVLGVGLGGARRLTYHEAIVAQGARELLASDTAADWLVPTLGGLPWLEKPPLAHWLVALCSGVAGGVSETSSRVPSALAAASLAGVVAWLAARRFGGTVGLLAGGVQLTTAWSIQRGRLADADMLLALLVAATLAVADRLRTATDPRSARAWQWAFFALLGGTSLVKGIGFGAVLAMASIGALVLWDRDRRTLLRFCWPTGWCLAALLALAWPLAIVGRYPEAVPLWLGHVTDRLAAEPRRFAGQPIGAFLLTPILQTLPWTPFALVGAWHSLCRSRREPGGADRLLWAWAVVPTLLLSMASVRNGHYLIHALPPWSIWAALGLVRLGDRLQTRRGWAPDRLRRATVSLFGAIGVTVTILHMLILPRVDHRGREWFWYAEAARQAPPDEPLVLLYDWDGPDPWDRLPYPTPFGPVPPDLAVRLFYLDRPARWLSGPDRLAAHPPGSGPFTVVARDRDLPALHSLGPVTELDRGPSHRWDRSYALFRVSPAPSSHDRLAVGDRPSSGADRSEIERNESRVSSVDVL